MRAALALILSLSIAVVSAGGTRSFLQGSCSCLLRYSGATILVSLLGLYGANSNVIQLNAKNFVQEVLMSDHVWLVEFYAPWLLMHPLGGHCKNLAPEWEKAATNLKGIVKIGAINCDEEENKPLAGQYGIKGFPTIKLFPSERTNKPPFKKEQDYQGDRSAAAIVQFATSKLPSFVKSLSSANFDKLFGESSLAKVLLFTDKAATTTLYKGLSVEFKDRLVLTEVKKSDTALVERYKVTSFPTLLVLKSADAEPVVYDGKLNADTLLSFLRPFAAPKSSGSSDSSSSAPPQDQGPTKAEVHRVKSQAEFEKHCLSQPLTCVITAVDATNAESSEIASQIAVLQSVAEKNNLFKRFAFVVIDGTKQTAIQKHFSLYSGFPSVVIYHPKKKASANYIGAFDVEAIRSYLDDVLVGKKKLYTDSGVPNLVDE